MEQYSAETGCDGMDLLDLLFDTNDGILRHEKMERSNQSWSVADNRLLIQPQSNEDFLNALLSGADSVSGSPQLSPSRSDSGISEDLHSDHVDSPLPSHSPPMESQYVYPNPIAANKSMETHLPIDLNGWEPGLFQGKTDEILYGPPDQGSQPSNGFPMTVKDLLLCGKSEAASHQSVQELILNEDERKLLAKEGVMLPAQLPLTKYEERILKKIRRKIRNKQSAQESRKKKKEYIDGLESRMAACTAQNQELQRKVFQLEKCNMSLIEQLRRLQAMVLNGSNKTAQTSTCVLVLLLSFSLLLFPSLKPFSDSKVSLEGDFSPVRVQSRSLHNIHSSRVMHAHNHHLPMPEDSATLKPLPGNKQVDDVRSFLEKFSIGQRLPDFDTVPHNESLHDHLHHHDDPISGRTATVTLRPKAKIRPHADDM